MTRVLFVSSNYPLHSTDPTTPIVANLATALGQLGVSVEVLAPHGPSAQRHAIEDGIVVHRFRYFRPIAFQKLIGGGSAMGNLRRWPFLWIQVPAFVISLWWNSRRLMKSGRFDLVHSHWIIPQGFVIEAARRHLTLPHLASVHGSDVFDLRVSWIDRLRRWVLENASLVTVNSEFTARRVLNLAPNLTTWSVVRQGVAFSPPNLEAIKAVRGRFAPAGGPLIIFVGRLVDQKGVGDLIDAMQEIVQKEPESVLICVGEGQQRRQYEALSEALGLEGHIRFLGWIDHGDLPPFIAASDVLIGPSRDGPDGAGEAQGVVFAEAMSVGTPVVASDSGGIEELVINEVTGLVVAQRSPTAIAAAALRIIGDANLSRRLAESAKRAASRLSVEETARSYRALYDHLTPG